MIGFRSAGGAERLLLNRRRWRDNRSGLVNTIARDLRVSPVLLSPRFVGVVAIASAVFLNNMKNLQIVSQQFLEAAFFPSNQQIMESFFKDKVGLINIYYDAFDVTHLNSITHRKGGVNSFLE